MSQMKVRRRCNEGVIKANVQQQQAPYPSNKASQYASCAQLSNGNPGTTGNAKRRGNECLWPLQLRTQQQQALDSAADNGQSATGVGLTCQ